MVSREEVRLAYRFLLGREPESEDAYAAHIDLPDVAVLRRMILYSEEGLSRLRAELRDHQDAVPFHYFRPVTAFIHIEKTGGTSLNHALLLHYGSHRASPEHVNRLPTFSLAEINAYEVVTGHFSYQEARAIPRSPKRIVTILRDPVARLVSFYRFHRAYPEGSSDDPLMRLARELDACDFFRHDAVRNSPRLDNIYLRTFSELPAERGDWEAERIDEARETAIRRLAEIDCVGLTEDMPSTFRLVASTLGIAMPEAPPRLNDTEALCREERGFREACRPEISPDLLAAVAPLIEHDEPIYAAARAGFRAKIGDGGEIGDAADAAADGWRRSWAKPWRRWRR